MKKLITLLFVAMLATAFGACDDGGSSTGSIQVTITNSSGSDGVALVAAYDDLNAMLGQQLPPYNNSDTGDAVNDGGNVVVTINNVAAGDYYVTAILETDAAGATGFGDPCQTSSAPYFMNDGQTYHTVSSTTTTVTVTKGATATVSGTFVNSQTVPCI